MEKITLTLKLPKSRANFLENYAKRNKKTVSELIEQYIDQIKKISKADIHPDIEKISGVIPGNIDAKEIYAQYILEKNS